jgi:hypothetical protein
MRECVDVFINWLHYLDIDYRCFIRLLIVVPFPIVVVYCLKVPLIFTYIVPFIKFPFVVPFA